MADIYDEISDELRADQMRTALLRFGPLLVALAVLIVLGVAGWQFWQWREGKQAERDATAYFQALQLAEAPDAASHQQAIPLFLDLASKGGEGYRTLSRLYAAALEADNNQLEDASALWDQVQADTGADPELRDLASLLWAQHHIDAGDQGPVLAHLSQLRAAGNPWNALAQESAAMLELRVGHVAQARKILHQVVEDITAQPGIRQRANLLLQEIGA